jgi:ribosome biogenesis GTPase
VTDLAADCRFADCRHQGEPGCAVQAALDDGRLAPGRLASFGKLQRELAHLQRQEDPRARQAQRKMWVARNKALRVHYKLKDGR